MLGSVLREPQVLTEIIAIGLKAEDFYFQKNQVVFQAMADLYADGTNPDAVLIAEHMRTAGTLDDAGGTEYMTSLWDQVMSAANAPNYARIVREKAMLRRLIAACREGQEASYSAEASAKEIIERVNQQVYEIALARNESKAQPITGLMLAILEEIDERAANAGQAPGISSGYPDLDDITNGWQDGQFIVVAARPSCGKTALATNFVVHAAMERSVPVLMFSLETDAKQIVTNMLCMTAGIEVGDVSRGTVMSNEDAMDRVNAASMKLRKSKIWVDDTPGIDVLQMRAKARHAVQHHGIRLIVLDYLQLMRGEQDAENKQAEIEGISKALKNLARDLKVPIIALAQLNRAVESREVPKPRLSDLRGSGSLEQDPDMVLMIYRKDYYQQEGVIEDDVDATIMVVKNRIGRTGDVVLRFRKKFLRFETKAFQHQEAEDARRYGSDG